MDKTILVTRPRGDERTLTDLLHAGGYRVIHEPLTDVVLRHTERMNIERALMDDPDAVIVTSRHGVNALALLTDMRDPFLLCVGQSTADAALSLGFTRIDVAEGTVQSLIERIASMYDEGTRFLYPSGEHVRVELDAVLESMGMVTERIVVYEAIAAEQLSDTLVEQLKRKQLDGVTFLSPRAAHIFTSLLAEAKIEETAERLHGICLSPSVAEVLREAHWKAIHIAQEPTLDSIAKCVDNAFKQA